MTEAERLAIVEEFLSTLRSVGICKNNGVKTCDVEDAAIECGAEDKIKTVLKSMETSSSNCLQYCNEERNEECMNTCTRTSSDTASQTLLSAEQKIEEMFSQASSNPGETAMDETPASDHSPRALSQTHVHPSIQPIGRFLGSMRRHEPQIKCSDGMVKNVGSSMCGML